MQRRSEQVCPGPGDSAGARPSSLPSVWCSLLDSQPSILYVPRTGFVLFSSFVQLEVLKTLARERPPFTFYGRTPLTWRGCRAPYWLVPCSSSFSPSLHLLCFCWDTQESQAHEAQSVSLPRWQALQQWLFQLTLLHCWKYSTINEHLNFNSNH